MAYASAAEADTRSSQQWAEITVKLGATLTKAAIAGSQSELPTRDGPLTEQQAALQSVLTEYKRQRASVQGNVTALRGLAEFAVDGTAVVLASTGVGAVPAAIVKGVGQLATDLYFDKMESETTANVEAYLAKKKDALLQAAGVDYNTLHGLPADQLRAKLKQSESVFADMRSMLPDDPKVQEMADQLLVEGIKNISLETLEKVAEQEERLQGVEGKVANLASALHKFEISTTETLEAHEIALGELNEAVGNLGEAVASIDKRLKSEERDQAIIADFVFDQMDPGLKAEALKQGFLAERFACPDGSTSCDGEGLKQDLIKRFESEAKLKEIVGGVGTTVAALNNVAAIARNIGLDIEGLDDAAQLGGVAYDAFNAFASGNYLGAIASITGAFGPRVDPAQERHKQLMAYLGQQFERINAKLDAILQNQQKILEALDQLSQQMAEHYQALDERLARMEFELNRASLGVRMILWKDWQSCYAVYEEVANREPEFSYVKRGDFASIEDIYKAATAMGLNVKECLAVAQARPISLGATEWFGNFLDLNVAINDVPEVVPADSSGEKYFNKAALQKFISNVHVPTIELVNAELARNGASWARAFDFMVGPTATYAGERQRASTLGATTQACGDRGFLLDRLKRLLCGTAEAQVNTRAFRLLNTPMLVDSALALSEWMLVEARFADIYDQINDRFFTAAELLQAAEDPQRDFSAGPELCRKALILLDVAMASHVLLYGDVSARAALNGLMPAVPAGQALSDDQSKMQEKARLVLKENPYLASNSAMLLLRDRYSSRFGKDEGALSPHTYRSALEYAVAAKGDPSFLLKGIFGDDVSFHVDAESQRVVLILASEVEVPMPTPQEFSQGRLSYPPRLVRIMQQRERVFDRLADYGFFAAVGPAMRPEIAALIAD